MDESENNALLDASVKLDSAELRDKKEKAVEKETALYSLRWWILALLTIQIILTRMIMNSIGVVNNVYKIYFDISYYAIDWFALIQTMSMMFASIILALLDYNSMADFRRFVFILICCSMISCIMSMLSFGYPFLYILNYVGQFMLGFGLETADPIVSAFASNWFPEHQIGLALSFKVAGMSFGCVLAFIIPTNIISPPPSSTYSSSNSSLMLQGSLSSANASLTWNDQVYTNFLLFYGSVLLMFAIILILSLFFVTELPPKPPTYAQVLVRAQPAKRGHLSDLIANMGPFIRECKSILFDKVVILIAIVITVTYSCNYLQKLLMGQIARDIFIHLHYGSRINSMSGYVLVLFEVGCVLGSLASGQVMLRWKNNKTLLLVALFATLIAMAGLAIGQFLFNIEIVFIFNTLLGFTLGLSFSPTFNIVLQHTYPKKPTLVILLFTGISMIGIVVVGQLCRLFLDNINGTAVFILMSVFVLISIALCYIVNPKHLREDASKFENNEKNKLQQITTEKGAPCTSKH